MPVNEPSKPNNPLTPVSHEIRTTSCRSKTSFWKLLYSLVAVKTAGTKHRSQVIVLPIQKVSQTLVKANLRPKNFCLGLIRPKVIFYKCLEYFVYW